MEHKLKEYTIDGMGIYLNFMRLYWHIANRPEAIATFKPLLKKFRKKRASKLHYFLWINDGTASNAYQNHLTPYYKIKTGENRGKYDLGEFTNKFIICYTKWLELLKEADLTPVVCGFMDTYCEVPFRKNVNNVDHFWHDRAFRFQRKLMRKVLRIEKAVFGADHWPCARWINEPRAHGDKHVWDHKLADYHVKAYKAIQEWVAIWNFYIDSSLREASHAHFTERHACSKCRPGDMYGDGHFGSDDFIHPGNKRPQIHVINHGYSIPQNLEDDFYTWMNSPQWRKPAKCVIGGDGGAGKHKDEALGYAITRPDGHIIWRQGNGQQTYDLVATSLQAAKDKNHYLEYQLAMFEVLKGWPLQEQYKRSNVHWPRHNAVRDAVLDTLYPDPV